MKKAGYLAVTAACLLSTVIMGAKTVYAANDTVEAAGNVTNISDEQADVVAKAMESLGMGVTYVDVDTGLTFNSLYDIIRYLDANSPILELENSNKNDNLEVEDGFKKDIAQEVWRLVNAERAANGIPELRWDEDTYEYACQRAQQLVTNYSHSGNDTNHGENIHMRYHTEDANAIHTSWYNSPSHHENYLNSIYNAGACAVYVKDGNLYAVENFTIPSSHVVGTWTASNGVIIEIYESGGSGVSEKGNENRTHEEIMAAWNEHCGIDNESGQSETYAPTYEYQEPTQTEPDTWTASNGVTVYVMNGNAYTINDGYSEDDHLNAWLEYSQSH